MIQLKKVKRICRGYASWLLLLMSGMLLHTKINAAIHIDQILGNNMVLQRGVPVKIWGQADKGEKVTVRFHKQLKTTITDENGRWLIWLDPMEASAKPAELTITGSTSVSESTSQTDKIILQNILVGEVWLCSGQSNMEYSMRKNSKVEKGVVDKGYAGNHSPIDELNYANNDQIRIFLVERKVVTKEHPLHDGWSIAKDSALRSFSAAGYFFAKSLYQKLHVPIGVISAAIPGSAIEPWLAGTITSDSLQYPLKIDYSRPGKFYPSMIEPVSKFQIKGFLWYQGETNCFQNESIAYTYKMQALISQWRHLWKDEKLPFYFVEIAPFNYSKSKGRYALTDSTLPLFWEAQSLALKIPYTGMIVGTDLPDNLNNIHPPGKWEIGNRLALLALGKTYHQKVEYSGPTYDAKHIKGNQLVLSFEHTGNGLISKDGAALTYFEIAGSDGKYYQAKAVISGNNVVLSSNQVKDPKQARFGWSESAQPNFFNKEGLPAVPFRTDNPYIGLKLVPIKF